MRKCPMCRGALRSLRSTRRTCSDACRQRLMRRRRGALVLRGCAVERVDPAEASALIRKHEHLGTTGNARLWIGLRSPAGRLLSLVGFGHGPHAAGGCAVLERGWTRPQAPRNAGSFLISRALRLLRKLGVRLVKAFTDPRFSSEQGVLYRSAGFVRQAGRSR